MLVVISPAKRLDWADRSVSASEPAFQEDAIRLAKTARNLSLHRAMCTTQKALGLWFPQFLGWMLQVSDEKL